MVCIAFWFIHQVSALNWVSDNWEKNCNTDPLDNSSWQKRIPSSNNLSAAPSWSTSCEFHGYYGGDWSSWRDLGDSPSWNHYACPNDRYASQIEYNGSNTQYRIYCKFRDDTPPAVSDVTWPSLTSRLATDTQGFRVDVADGGGAPISLIQVFFEEADNNDQYYLVNSDASPDINIGNAARLQINNWDIQKVDNDTTQNNGKRTYKAFISYIADEAGNEVGTLGDNDPTNAIVAYNYKVYANTTTLTLASSTKVATSNLNANSNIADGSEKYIDILLRDRYGNKIIPVWDISREISFDIDIDNLIRRNQYNNTSSNSALFIDGVTQSVPIGTANPAVSLSNRPSSSWSYYIPFHVFAPTFHHNSLAPWSGEVASISLNTSGSWAMSGILIDNSNITIKARPLYTTVFSGNLVDVWFVEWIEQGSELSITKNVWSSVSVSNPSVRMEFGTGSSNNVNPDYNIEINTFWLEEGHQTPWGGLTEITNSFLSPLNVKSFMKQEWAVSTENHSYLASIIKYSIDIDGTDRNIVYPWHVIWKDSYHGSTIWGVNSYQSWVKITWNTTSQNTGELISGQFNKDVHIVWKFVKSTQKKQIQKNVYQALRNVSIKTSGSLSLSSNDVDDADWSANKFNALNTGSRGTSIYGEDVLYFWNLWGKYVELRGVNDIQWEKTIIVEDGDIYISGDILNPDNKGILGIIVLWGNIYIDPSVTDIHAVMYTDKSIISARDINSDGDIDISWWEDIEYDGTNTTSLDLTDQLYIYGTVFSENTVGWSRKSPAECPYYQNSGCTQELAQKYDFNYLRRYYIYDSWSWYDVDTTGDTINDKNKSWDLSQAAIGDYTLRVYPVIIDYNPQIQQTPPPLFD